MKIEIVGGKVAKLIATGELVYDWREYEFADLKIDDENLAYLVQKFLPVKKMRDVGAELSSNIRDYHTETYYGPVRITIEILG